MQLLTDKNAFFQVKFVLLMQGFHSAMSIRLGVYETTTYVTQQPCFPEYYYA